LIALGETNPLMSLWMEGRVASIVPTALEFLPGQCRNCLQAAASNTIGE